MKYLGLFMLYLAASVLAGDLAFAQEHEECGLFTIDLSCDLSGWVGIIVGDLLIALILALLLQNYSTRSNKKIEQNIEMTKRILSEQKIRQDKLRTYVVQALKNHLSVILLCMGVINKFSQDSSEQHVKMVNVKRNELIRILDRGKSMLGISIDVLDPMLVEQIEKFFTQVETKVDGAEKGIPDYEELKKTLNHLAGRLNEYTDSQDVLK